MHASHRLLLPTLAALTLTLAAAITLARGAEDKPGKLAVLGAWARATPPGATVGAGYMTIENRGGEPDRLLSAASPIAGSVELHETVRTGDVATMRPVANPTVPPGGALAMAPGGAHLMLMDLTAPLQPGQSVPLTLTFEKAGAIDVSMEVLPIGAAGPEHTHHDHGS